MMKQGEWPPLMVVFDPKEGFTVEADVFIRDWTIITEYAGDVDYLKNREADDGDSMMTLLSTNDPSKDLVICPDKHSNIARFINGINNHTPPQLHGLCKSWKLLQPATSGSIFKVDLFKHPHLLLLQVRHSMYKLPGGRLRPGESEIECLRRKLSSKLSMSEEDDSWEVGECLGMWWRPDYETLIYPFLPPDIKRPKECTKLFLVRLPESCKFILPKNLKLIAVPLCQVHENFKTYGPIIAGVPQLLSKFSYNKPDTD